MTKRGVVDFLTFWQKLADRSRTGERLAQWKARQRKDLGQLGDIELAQILDFWRRKYEQSEADRVSSASRANNLLALTSIVTAATTLIIGSVAGAQSEMTWIVLIVGGLLVLAAFATVVLSIRTQQVSKWDVPDVAAPGFSSSRALTLAIAVEYLSAATQNSYRLNNIFGYLRDAQRWALVAVTMLVILAPAAVTAQLTKPATSSSSTNGTNDEQTIPTEVPVDGSPSDSQRPSAPPEQVPGSSPKRSPIPINR